MISSIFLVAALQQQAPYPSVQSVTHGRAAAAGQRVHRVVPGDTLSAIAPTMGESWPQLYAGNRAVIGDNPNLIYAGEVLHVGTPTRTAAAHTSTAAAHTSTAARPAPDGRTRGVSYGDPNYCGDGDGDGWDVPCATRVQHLAQQPVQQPVQHLARQPVQRGSGRARFTSVAVASFAGSGSMQRCIIARESGGNSQVVNASGHYGLYQFSASTWAGSGGNPADFGHASVAEQNRVFANAVAIRGYSDWAPYDGC